MKYLTMAEGFTNIGNLPVKTFGAKASWHKFGKSKGAYSMSTRGESFQEPKVAKPPPSTCFSRYFLETLPVNSSRTKSSTGLMGSIFHVSP